MVNRIEEKQTEDRREGKLDARVLTDCIV